MVDSRLITAADVGTAQTRIQGHVRRTPLLRVHETLALKCEFLQHTGVFKTRGAFNRQLAAREQGELRADPGIVVASGGNAGLANAYAARRLGVAATVFVPETAPAVKVARLRDYGAVVVQVGAEYVEALAAARVFCDERGAVFCHAYDQVEVAAGAGTLALEIIEAAPDTDTVVVAVGGGGLYAGVAVALEGHARVVTVEPTGIPTLHEALAAGRPVDVRVSSIAADALGARRVGDLAFDVARRVAPTSVLVSDNDIRAARNALWSDFRIPSEHGAATAYAALTSGAYVPAPGEKVVVVICGANTDVTTLGL